MSNKRNTTLTNISFFAVLLFCLAGVGTGAWMVLSPEPAEHPDTPRQNVVSAADADDTLTTVINPTQVTEPISTTDPEPTVIPTQEPEEQEPEPEPEIPVVAVTVPEPAPKPAKPVVAVAPNPVVMPLEGEVVAAFSMDALAYNETLADWRTHDGIDIAAEAGTGVLAAAGGTVADVREDALLGTTVVIQHKDGYRTTYASLEPELAVKFGETVTSGQLIGAVGVSAGIEAAAGPHLHFSVSKDGIAVDPAEYLEQ